MLGTALLAGAAVLAIILVLRPPTSSSGTAAANGTEVAQDLGTQEQTEDGARAAAQQTLDAYAGGDYGAFWDRWTTASQALMGREDFIRMHTECAQPAQGVRFVVGAVTVTGTTARVGVTRLIAATTFDFTFEDGAWRYVLPAEQQAEYRKGVDQIVRERKASNQCGRDALKLTPVPMPTPSSDAPTSAAPPAAATKVGQPVQVGDLTFTVTRVEQGAQLKEPITNKPVQAQGQWVLVHVSVTSHASKAIPILGGRQALVDDQGRAYRQDAQAANYDMGDLALVIKPINPNQTLTGAFVYDVPAGSRPTALELHDYAQADSPAVKVSLS
ncbi:DUF4352 domain-containing protein [Streptosporangium sp. NPDC001559]|uniref:DUF4352 domain-containing protein n=1 Tax=Streptosporangium sp. NPDC001559 TaxID=3366187 RepID=UPI0036ED4A26